MHRLQLACVLVLVCSAAVLAQENSRESSRSEDASASAAALSSQALIGSSAFSQSSFAESSFGGSDALNLGSSPPGMSDMSNTLPPYNTLNSQATVSPNIASSTHQALSLDLDRRIKQTEDLLNRMVWQLNRETSWANSVHDIIQNYQYKYTKVLSNIKKHSERTGKMRELASALKKARLHEILEEDLAKATRELTELATASAETSEDEGSYAALKDRVALMKADLEKMSHKKVNKALHKVQDALKKVGSDAIPSPSSDTLKDLLSDSSKAGKK